MAAEKNWEIFLGLLCDSEEIRESRIYKLIIEKYPIQFMHKLISTAVDGDQSSTTRDRAAVVILEINNTHLLENNYSSIDTQTLEFLRRSAIDLMIQNEVGSDFQVCGEQMAMKLVRVSLEFDQRWDGFLEFTEESFSSSQPAHLDLVIAIFAVLSRHLRDKLVRNLEPCIRRNSAQFEATMLHLLEKGDDDRPFLILPCIIHTFNQTMSSRLTQGAIMSPFFYKGQSYRRIRVAVILQFCIEHTTPFQLSTAAHDRMLHLICLLRQSTNARENRAGLQLFKAFRKKVEEYYPPSKCRGR